MTEQETQTYSRKTFEETMSKLAEYLGTTDLQLIKMFSILDAEGIRKKAMMLGDIENYKSCDRLKAYAYQDLFLNVSGGEGTGRKQLVEIIKGAIQISNEPQEQNRLRKMIGDLFK